MSDDKEEFIVNENFENMCRYFEEFLVPFKNVGSVTVFPSTDDILALVKGRDTPKAMFLKIAEWLSDPRIARYAYMFDSFQELLLAYYADIRYNIVWNGSEWKSKEDYV